MVFIHHMSDGPLSFLATLIAVYIVDNTTTLYITSIHTLSPEGGTTERHVM
jgi:hypothetical protein